MSKELEALEALEDIKNCIVADCIRPKPMKECSSWEEELNAIETTLKDFEELKKGIAWRKAEYKKELDSGVDGDGEPLSETNKMIVSNLYNIMCALESYYKEKN